VDVPAGQTVQFDEDVGADLPAAQIVQVAPELAPIALEARPGKLKRALKSATLCTLGWKGTMIAHEARGEAPGRGGGGDGAPAGQLLHTRE